MGLEVALDFHRTANVIQSTAFMSRVKLLTAAVCEMCKPERAFPPLLVATFLNLVRFAQLRCVCRASSTTSYCFTRQIERSGLASLHFPAVKLE